MRILGDSNFVRFLGLILILSFSIFMYFLLFSDWILRFLFLIINVMAFRSYIPGDRGLGDVSDV